MRQDQTYLANFYYPFYNYIIDMYWSESCISLSYL